MTFREFTGKNVEEAIRAAMAEFSSDLGELDIEILAQGSRGVLGVGAEDARILAAPKSAIAAADSLRAEPERAEPPRAEPRRAETRRSEPRRDEPIPVVDEAEPIAEAPGAPADDSADLAPVGRGEPTWAMTRPMWSGGTWTHAYRSTLKTGHFRRSLLRL